MHIESAFPENDKSFKFLYFNFLVCKMGIKKKKPTTFLSSQDIVESHGEMYTEHGKVLESVRFAMVMRF